MCWSLDANDARAARAARKAATAALGRLTAKPDSLGAAELVIGELLSNAARHADGFVCLELSHRDGNAQISVHDTSSTFTLDVQRPPDEYAESGRGLYIISELALKIDVQPLTGMGKRVMVTLDLPVPADAAIEPVCRRSWLRHEDGICLRPRAIKYHPEFAIETES